MVFSMALTEDGTATLALVANNSTHDVSSKLEELSKQLMLVPGAGGCVVWVVYLSIGRLVFVEQPLRSAWW